MQTIHEIWLPVTGYEKFYKISSLGNVLSLDRECPGTKGGTYIKPSRLLKQDTSSGYAKVTLTDENRKPKTFFVHRLVAIEFLEGPQLETVNHKDTNKLNNSYTNLEWATNLDNIKHAVESGLYSPYVMNRGKLSPEQVSKIRQLRSEGQTLGNLSERFGVSTNQISLICRNKSWIL